MNTPIITLLDEKYINGQTILDINALLQQLSTTSKPLTYNTLHEALNDNIKICIALSKTRIIGMGTVCKISRLGKTTCEIHDVVVDRDYRGQGIAHSILQKLIQEAHLFDAEYIELTSNPKRLEANQLYITRGFVLRDTNCYRLTL